MQVGAIVLARRIFVVDPNLSEARAIFWRMEPPRAPELRHTSKERSYDHSNNYDARARHNDRRHVRLGPVARRTPPRQSALAPGPRGIRIDQAMLLLRIPLAMEAPGIAWPHDAVTKSSQAAQGAVSAVPVTYHRMKIIDGIKIFYREAGPKDGPVVLLLHGFPTSSHMFRNLIPALAGRYRVIAPDYPSYGKSDMPDRAKFAYTFDRFANSSTACLISSESRDMRCMSWTTGRPWAGGSPCSIRSA
jgi:hypothetical protein